MKRRQFIRVGSYGAAAAAMAGGLTTDGWGREEAESRWLLRHRRPGSLEGNPGRIMVVKTVWPAVRRPA
jgi:hypothetical protein